MFNGCDTPPLSFCHPSVILLLPSFTCSTRRNQGRIFSCPFHFWETLMPLIQLCHYANPEYGGLQIYIILGPKEWNVGALRKFVGRSKTRQEAVNRLHIKRFGHDQHFSTATYSHSKAMVSSAGAMIGSYNLTGAARLRHTEHSVLLGPDSNIEGLRDEFRQMWDKINTGEIKISRTPSPSKNAPPDPRKVHDPYKRPKTK